MRTHPESFSQRYIHFHLILFLGKEEKKTKTPSGDESADVSLHISLFRGLECSSLSDGVFCPAVWPVACAVPQTVCHTIRSACLGDRDSSCYVVKCKLSYQLETLATGDFSEHLSRACQHPETTESRVMHALLCPGRVSLKDTLVKSPKLEMAEGISYSSNFWMILWRKQCLEKRKILLPDVGFGSNNLMMSGEHLKNIYFFWFYFHSTAYSVQPCRWNIFAEKDVLWRLMGFTQGTKHLQ